MKKIKKRNERKDTAAQTCLAQFVIPTDEVSVS